MRFLIDFLRQKAPRPGMDMPAYYRRALDVNEKLLAVYFLLTFVLFGLVIHRWEYIAIAMLLGIVACLENIGRINVRLSLYAHCLITMVWCAWYVIMFGWNCGTQHFLIPLMMLSFFNIYESPWRKLGFFLICIAFRMGLYAYTLNHSPIIALATNASILFQTVNSVTIFIVLACQFILFSSSIQDTERQLTIDNQELHKEAGTDPLTQLPNRRAMIDEIDRFRENFPANNFSVAIADIDFFKRVNDTYGHNCGDYTLQTLAALFRENAGDVYRVCRWGGEEFCFFLPNMNIDDAGNIMFDLGIAVKKMPLCFAGNEFSITITIGVEEYDFQSSMEDILEKADQKLYQGKISGRDRVVI